jgi:hypothetical protein
MKGRDGQVSMVGLECQIIEAALLSLPNCAFLIADIREIRTLFNQISENLFFL